jgi:hypothetical protein
MLVGLPNPLKETRMKRRLIMTAAVGAALTLSALTAAAPAFAVPEGSNDGLNECMQAAEGGCSGGPFDGMGAGGGPMSSQERFDAAVTFLSAWKVGLVLPTSDGYVRFVQRPYGTSVSWESTQAYADAFDTVMGNQPASTRCASISDHAEMICQSPN